jgi:arginine exporter protein ArgO
VWNARTGRQAGMFLRHVVPAIVKPAHALWNEVIGFIFFCIAGLLGFSAVRSWMQHDSFRTVVATCGMLFLGSFAVSSFRRARKISRS